MRRRWKTFVLVPLVISAAAVLAYYTWVGTSRFRQLGEETISDNTLLLVREKVEQVERYIIAQDHVAFDLVDLSDLSSVTRWRPQAAELTPSVRALFVLDQNESIVSLSVRGRASDEAELRRVFRQHVRRALEIDQVPVDRLKHLHGTFGDRNYLFSYKTLWYEGERFTIVVHHDTGYIVREELPQLFATEEGRETYNVVTTDNRRVYGQSLADAGGFLVGLRFPTTLYNWRLQLAPKQGAELAQQDRSRRVMDIALLATAFLVVLLGIALFIRAAAQERHLNNLKGEFIANVSHELKTPLSSVRMFGELLLSDLDRQKLNEEKRRQYLGIICRESERLTALIENVLDFAALERGRARTNLGPANLVSIAQRALETFRYRVDEDPPTLKVISEIPSLTFTARFV